MKIEIKSWLSDSVLFCGDYKNILDALKSAIKSGANLSGADLSRANLYGANLSGANLSGVNLSRANIDTKYCFLSISPVGSENGCLWVMRGDDGVLKYSRGCFYGTEQEFVDAVKNKHSGTEIEKKYLAAVSFIKIQLGEK
jgi:hypothetical protein